MQDSDNMTSLPLGFSDFSILRIKSKIYVDKTNLIGKLARDDGFYFLSRPRRFGKTLLVSTIESLFKDGLTHFKGLAIAKNWNDGTYPVIRMDFTACRIFQNIDEFRVKFENMVFSASDDAGFALPKIGTRGIGCVADAFEKMLKNDASSPVLLMDEYDAPLNSCLHDPKLFEEVQAELFSFYDCLKRLSSRFRLILVTGICRYQNLGIFSGVNFMTDISMRPEYGTLLGYTEDELRIFFGQYIEHAALVQHLSVDECVKRMAYYYDGYCFDKNASKHVYTPWSVLNFLRYPEDGFQNYWYDSAGRPSVLLNYIKSHSLKDPRAYGADQTISADELNSSQGLADLSDVGLLVQAGYLTIKSVEPGGEVFTVNYPNAEVSRSMSKLYAEQLFGKKADTLIKTSSLGLFMNFAKDEIVKSLNLLFKTIDYERYPVNDEASLRSFLQIYLTGGGITELNIEKHNAFGRSDLEFRAGDRYFVIELKYARDGDNIKKLLDSAKDQVIKRQYGEQVHPELEHVRLALVFSQKDRQFVADQFF